ASLAVQGLKPKHFSDLLRDLRVGGAGGSTLRGVLIVCSGIIEYVLRNHEDVLVVSPLARIERPKYRNKTEPRYLDLQEISKLLAKASETYRTLLVTALYTGMRQSELLGLQWQDLDFEPGLVHVRSQLSRATKAKPARRMPLKTDAGRREIIL